MDKKNSLGCSKRFKRRSGKTVEVENDCDFICGVADGWGKEHLCQLCDWKLRMKWAKEDKEKENYLNNKGGIL